VFPEQPQTVLAEAAHPDVSWGKVSFLVTSTGDNHAAQSNALILEQALADNLCTKKRAPSYGACPKNETWRIFLFFSAHWPSATVQ